MSVFDDVNRFLEKQLEEFLRVNPHLELQVLADNLREQDVKTTKLLAELEAEEQRQQDAILATAKEIQRWHARIKKAEGAGRQDLVNSGQGTGSLVIESREPAMGTNGSDQKSFTTNPSLVRENSGSASRGQREDSASSPQTPGQKIYFSNPPIHPAAGIKRSP